MEKIKIVFKEPNKNPIEMEIDNTLEKLHELVGGYIEVVPENQECTILMIINEEGKLKGLEPNIASPYDTIVGNIVFVKNIGDGEFHSLTEDMIKYLLNKY